MLALACASGCARASLVEDDAAVTPFIPLIDGSVAEDASQADAAQQPAVDAAGPDTPPPIDAAMPRDAAGGGDGGSTEPPESECKPGIYTGTFEGDIKLFELIALPITGEISITISTESTGEDLVIENGTIHGEDQDGNPVQADVEGVLDCGTKQLVGGKLLNGTYTRKSLNQTVNFQGTASATYLPGNPPSVMGTWKTDGGLLESGAGTFGATWSAPL